MSEQSSTRFISAIAGSACDPFVVTDREGARPTRVGRASGRPSALVVFAALTSLAATPALAGPTDAPARAHAAAAAGAEPIATSDPGAKTAPDGKSRRAPAPDKGSANKDSAEAKGDPRTKGAPPASARAATARQRARDAKLAKGTILMHTRKVKGFGVPRIISELVINAPPSRVWARVRDCRNLKAVVPALAKIKVQADTPTRQRCWMEVETPFPFSDLESVLDYKRIATPQRFSLSFRMHKGDYVRNRGEWTITAFDAAGKRARVRYALHTVPKTRAPDSAITWGTKRNVRHMLSALQKTLR